MDDILKSIKDWFQEKTTSPLVGIFLGFFVTWNWKYFYILFWSNLDIHNTQSKIERIDELRFSHYFLNSLEKSEFYNWVIDKCYILSIPILLTILYILFFPKVSKIVYEKMLDNKYERKIYSLGKTNDFNELKEKNLDSKLLQIDKEKAIIKKKESTIMDNKNNWDNDYEKFKLNDRYHFFEQLINEIEEGHPVSLPGLDRGYFKIIGVIEEDINDPNNEMHPPDIKFYQFTEKGRYFVSRFFTE